MGKDEDERLLDVPLDTGSDDPRDAPLKQWEECEAEGEPKIIGEKLLLTAEHEACHALIRWLLKLPMGELWADESGEGTCAGTGMLVDPHDKLLVVMAGPAAECAYGFRGTPDWRNSHSDDLAKARRILNRAPHLRIDPATDSSGLQSVEDALSRYFTTVCDILWSHDWVIENLSYELADCGRLSAEAVVETIVQAIGDGVEEDR